jgi:hypothetical protein
VTPPWRVYKIGDNRQAGYDDSAWQLPFPRLIPAFRQVRITRTGSEAER